MTDQPQTQRRTLHYSPAVFNVVDQGHAKAVILTEEQGVDTDQRWERETPYLAHIMRQHLGIGPDQLVLDYGCGIGRLSRALIEACGCRVIGVDISQRMRALAADYVASDRFFACPPEMLDRLLDGGLRIDRAIAVWVLQHCFRPAEDVARIARALTPAGRLMVVNNRGRVVPTVEAPWVDDGLDLAAMLAQSFQLEQMGQLDGSHVTDYVANFSFCGVYRATPPHPEAP